MLIAKSLAVSSARLGWRACYEIKFSDRLRGIDRNEYGWSDNIIGRVSYLIYVSMRHYVLTTSGDIVLCYHAAVCLSC